ncbi:hypothetical protein M0813_05405 [Anaeramoeba flamelloides]|uniref:Uncharacterized protein n=1 Tax=Anaeramoeba flamelloides TaxID=1746091 RepID=A0ABQ8XIP6_9EUKA|nr:hypothetical protein M0813_05405 [Anaeramoeba flamelloides]
MDYSSNVVLKRRYRTTNQKRLEFLLKNYPNSIQGLDNINLDQPNCPKFVKISTLIIDSGGLWHWYQQRGSNIGVITLEDLTTYMLSKFNLFPFYNHHKTQNSICTSDQSCISNLIKNGKWLCFKFYKAKGYKQLIERSISENFQGKMVQIEKKLQKAFSNQPNWFIGLDKIHFSPNFKTPNKITINKHILNDLCVKYEKIINNLIIKEKLKTIYRAFAFFFTARYNLVNATNKNRKELKYTRWFDGYLEPSETLKKTKNRETNILHFGMDPQDISRKRTIKKLNPKKNKKRKMIKIKKKSITNSLMSQNSKVAQKINLSKINIRETVRNTNHSKISIINPSPKDDLKKYIYHDIKKLILSETIRSDPSFTSNDWSIVDLLINLKYSNN